MAGDIMKIPPVFLWRFFGASWFSKAWFSCKKQAIYLSTIGCVNIIGATKNMQLAKTIGDIWVAIYIYNNIHISYTLSSAIHFTYLENMLCMLFAIQSIKYFYDWELISPLLVLRGNIAFKSKVFKGAGDIQLWHYD